MAEGHAEWPFSGWIDDVRPALRDARDGGRAIVLATLVRLEGSAPRPIGTQMLFDGDAAVGYFSGGCVEADVALHARAVIADGAPRLLVYGRGSPWIDVRLLCGGRMKIFLERIAPNDPAADRLLDHGDRRRPALWRSDGCHREVRDGADAARLSFGGDPPRLELRLDPPWRLIVIGRDPTALALADLARRAGFGTTLLCPFGPATPPRDELAYCRGAVEAELAALGLDAWTAVAVATHEPDLDHAALAAALPARPGYVGVLGAADRLQERRSRLAAAGVPADALARLRAPMGVAGCGKASWEVAVAVMAEIMQVRAARTLT